MTITFPRDIFSLCASVTGTTDLKRFQAMSLTGDGSPASVDVAPSIWRGQYSITVTGRETIAAAAAWCRSLRGGLRTFKGIPIRTGKLYRWPLSRPRGFDGLTISASPWGGSGNLSDIADGKDTITIDELPNGLVLSPGDYVSFPVGSVNHLHMILDGGTVSGNEVTVTVEPIVRQDAVTDVAVRFESPFCEMTLSGEVSEPQNDRLVATFSFSAYQKPR